MSRIALNCTCGWNFFIPGSTPGCEIACPSCTQLVRIPGRKPGEDVPLTPGEIAAKIQRRAAVVRSTLFLLGLAVIGGAAALALMKEGPPPPEQEPSPARGEARPRAPSGIEMLPATRPSSVGSPKTAQIHRRILENVWQTNLASIVGECLRLRNLAREWKQVQSEVAALAQKIKADQQELAALKELVSLDPYFAEGDRIVSFGSRDFSVLRRYDAARVLHEWLNAWRPGGAVEQVDVLREERRVTIYLHFPEENQDLRLLARHPLLQAEPLADRGPPAMAAAGSLPAEKIVDLIAPEVCSRTQVFAEVIQEMRRRTEPLTTAKVPIWPDESARGIALIGNPLTFVPKGLPEATAREIGQWWNGLTPDERIRFAKFFGLWCAHTRAKDEKK